MRVLTFWWVLNFSSVRGCKLGWISWAPWCICWFMSPSTWTSPWWSPSHTGATNHCCLSNSVCLPFLVLRCHIHVQQKGRQMCCKHRSPRTEKKTHQWENSFRGHHTTANARFWRASVSCQYIISTMFLFLSMVNTGNSERIPKLEFLMVSYATLWRQESHRGPQNSHWSAHDLKVGFVPCFLSRDVSHDVSRDAAIKMAALDTDTHLFEEAFGLRGLRVRRAERWGHVKTVPTFTGAVLLWEVLSVNTMYPRQGHTLNTCYRGAWCSSVYVRGALSFIFFLLSCGLKSGSSQKLRKLAWLSVGEGRWFFSQSVALPRVLLVGMVGQCVMKK